ncbi:SprT family zinc-dependent metalloprotease [Coraliomargarita sp. SDUM461004]|uniref:SprT family zinc-dependent metalloprotease n=1 Tax=Thalassobacterium sedimentorum TaxID=3041258 RepID=A0ABU1AHE2_9BACT|nr:SprT family zinc-dependent metalloprotease [Coraliomargarita sp. SDUM461004]MDQ8194240.1 SprT family zinc-dependent metalloprotease [Coraliomargarita sp. SDUM461004]
MNFVNASGHCVPVEIRRRKGTRRLRLSLGQQNQVVASVPWHVSQRAVVQFIEQHRTWLDAQLAQLPALCSLSSWFQRHPRISASGDVFALRIEDRECRQPNYCFEQQGAVLVLRLPVIHETAIRQLIRRFAKDALTCRVAYHAKRLGLNYTTLSVRDQASRWGSCSARRGISLNWRLILLTPSLQDYVILHELAHLSEMNHGPNFWALLDLYDPQRVRHEAELDACAAELMRVARA